MVSAAMTRDRESLQAAVDALPYWHHSIDLGHGVVTPGVKSPAYHREELELLHLPDLTGKTVLDVGAWDGYYAFEAERRGAARVVAMDSYIWQTDLSGWGPPERRRHVSGPLPGRCGFELARAALGSSVEAVECEVLDAGPETLGTFDVVLFLGVLYHMRHPLLALERMASVTRELLVVETHMVDIPHFEHVPLWEFYEGTKLADDPTNWWAPNVPGVLGMLRAAGFREATLVGETPRPPRDGLRFGHFRGFAHARP
jgi:tRNA (mo5U34)-methyltransferase